MLQHPLFFSCPFPSPSFILDILREGQKYPILGKYSTLYLPNESKAKRTRRATDWTVMGSMVDVNCCSVVPAYIPIGLGSASIWSPDIRSPVIWSPDIWSVVIWSPDIRSAVIRSPDNFADAFLWYQANKTRVELNIRPFFLYPVSGWISVFSARMSGGPDTGYLANEVGKYCGIIFLGLFGYVM